MGAGCLDDLEPSRDRSCSLTWRAGRLSRGAGHTVHFALGATRLTVHESSRSVDCESVGLAGSVTYGTPGPDRAVAHRTADISLTGAVFAGRNILTSGAKLVRRRRPWIDRIDICG